MGIKKYIKNTTDKICFAGSGVIGAGVLGQFPQYLAQYVQRAGGHIDEAKNIALTQNIPQLYERAEKKQEGINIIQESGTLEKLINFVKHADYSIAQRTYEHFTPGMTFDSEGMIYGGIGAILGATLYSGVKNIGKGILKL
jgi:hypothetical protein